MATYSVSNSNGRFTLTLTVTETSYSVINNTSDLAWSLDLKANTSWHFSNYGIGRWVTINGTNVLSMSKSESPRMTLNGHSSINLGSGTLNNVAHNSDGTKTVSISFSIEVTSAEHTPGNLSGYGSLTLTTIPRKASISATDANIGSTSAIIIYRKTTTFKYTLQYSLNKSSWTNIVTNYNSDNYGWTIPTSFYSLIPNDRRLTVYLRCITYNGSTEVGISDVISINANTDEAACKPNLANCNVVDTDILTQQFTDDSSKLVRGYSKAKCTATYSAKNSATIKSAYVKCGDGKTCNIGDVINSPESATFVFYVVDSRDYVTTFTYTKESSKFIEYVKPTCRANFYRPSPTSGEIAVSVDGNFWSGSFGRYNNNLNMTISYRKKGNTAWIPLIDWWESVESNIHDFSLNGSNKTYSKTASLGTIFTYTDIYEFSVSIHDRLTTIASFIATVSQGLPVFDWGKNDFTFHVPVGMDTPLPVASGGTGAATASGALTSLGLSREVGTLVSGSGITFQNVLCEKYGNIVHFSAYFTTTTSIANFSNLITLPSGWKPAISYYVVAASISGVLICYVTQTGVLCNASGALTSGGQYFVDTTFVIG